MYLEKNKLYKHLDFILLDIICMEVSFILAYYFRHHDFLLFNNSLYRSSLIILIIANIITCYMFNSMQDILKRSKQLEFYATIKQVLFTVMILVLYLYVTKTSTDISRSVIINFPIVYLIISYIFRLIYKNIVIKSLKNIPKRQFIVLTTSGRVLSLINQIRESITDISVKGIILIDYISSDVDSNVNNMIMDIPVVAYRDNAIKYLQKEYVDEVLVVNEDLDISSILLKISLMGIIIHYELKDIGSFVSNNAKLRISNISDMVVITSSLNVITPIQLFFKRTTDIIFGIFGSLLTIVFAIIIGPIIKIKSKGPIFFVQDRVGRNGKIFKMIKFRSMYLDADKDKVNLLNENENSDDLMFKMENDPRIIKGIGEFIRKTSIDEFPQFINVLIGDMSVVGTRPPTVDEWGKYDLHHRARLAIKPGITGLWQVSGRSNIKNFEDVVKLDTEYIRNFSLWQDFSIIFKTIKVVIFRVGAK